MRFECPHLSTYHTWFSFRISFCSHSQGIFFIYSYFWNDSKTGFFFIFLFLLLSTFLFSHLERFLPFFYYTFFWDDVSNESRLIRRSNSIRIIKYWHDQIKSKKNDEFLIKRGKKSSKNRNKQNTQKKCRKLYPRRLVIHKRAAKICRLF